MATSANGPASRIRERAGGPRTSRGHAAAVAVGFNVGVEIGQLALVSVFLPLAFFLRHSWFYRRLVLGLGSVLIAAVASVWLVERGLDLDITVF